MLNKQNMLSEDKQAQEYIKKMIKKGSMIPIISNSFRLGQIFREENQPSKETVGLPAPGKTKLTIDKILTEKWANEIAYPLQDKHDLARVAQYWQVENKEKFRTAKEQYLDSLKSFLLNHIEKTLSGRNGESNEELESFKTELERLRNEFQEYSFSQLVVEQLSYPRFSPEADDPLRLLARLDLPIYITTSHFDFLERAIRSEWGDKKEPHTQVCSWGSSAFDMKPEHQPDPGYTPSQETPAVYHLYGLEDYPASLVLSEDDYLNFLISMFENTNNLEPLIPSKLRKALATQPLLLLGFQLEDWDFRVLFRFLLKFRQSAPQRSLIIQLKPDREQMGEPDKSVEYLNHYFDNAQFNLFWEDAESFIQSLYKML